MASPTVLCSGKEWKHIPWRVFVQVCVYDSIDHLAGVLCVSASYIYSPEWTGMLFLKCRDALLDFSSLFFFLDSSQEYTDSTGIDVHEFLVNTLKNNPRYEISTKN